MSSGFCLEYSLFKEKLQKFISSSSFENKTHEYRLILEKIRSALPQQREAYLQTSPDFIATVEKSLTIMQRIVSLHDELDQIFKMDENELGAFCDHDLKKVELIVSKGLEEVAELLYQFEKISQQGRKIIEVLEDPFLSQGS